MNNPDLTTVAAGQIRDEMKKRIEVLIHQPPELTVRLRIAEACEWLREGAPGRALEVLEELLAEFERADLLRSMEARPMTATEAQARGLPVTSNANREKINQEVAAWEGAVKARAHEMGHLPCGCPRAMESLCPHTATCPRCGCGMKPEQLPTGLRCPNCHYFKKDEVPF